MRPAKTPGLSAVQKGIYTKITAIPLAVYDEAPENAAYPYVTLGETSTTDAGNKTGNADDHYETINIWSRAKGFKQCKDMMSAIITAISGSVYAEPGYRIVFVETDQVTTLRDPDGLTRHGVVRAKFNVTQG